jgi:hypothetical protein
MTEQTSPQTYSANYGRYADFIPDEVEANLEWRSEVNGRGQRDPSFADEIQKICARDILFFFKGFLYTYDPRKTGSSAVLPFIPYDFQRDVILDLYRSVYEWRQDILVEKSRDVGATWMPLAVYCHGFLFVPYSDFLLGSRKQEYVYKAGDKKTLFWKIEFMLQYLPPWMRQPVKRTELLLQNLANGSTIAGESANADFGRGDRKTSAMLDELPACEYGAQAMGATDDTTPSRILIGTPKGTGNEYYRIRQSGNTRVVTIHWSQHPEKNPGLYRVTMDDERQPSVEVLDEEWHRAHPDYGFVMEPGGYQGLRSPWYDAESKRRGRLRTAQELDIDYLASVGQLADPATIDRLIQDTAMPAVNVGDLVYDGDLAQPKGFRNIQHGRLHLWTTLDGTKPPEGDYVIGGDIAVGSGASNSVWVVADRRTKEQVAEFASPNIKPAKFAEYGVTLARWFHGAQLIWEANGHGRITGDRIVDLEYPNIFLRRREESLDKPVSAVAGWYSTPEGKLALLAEYLRALETGEIICRSEDCLQELLDYVYHQDGQVEHADARGTEDPTGARKNHGDRVVAAALCWHGMQADAAPEEDPLEPEFAPNTAGARRQAYEAQMAADPLGAEEWQ